jgi:endonuclease I
LYRTLVLSFLLLVGFQAGIAQIPPGYYTSAIGLTRTPLQQALHDIIKNHTAKSYDYIWTAFQTTDDKPNGTVWDIYSDIPNGTPNGNPPYIYTFITDQCGNASHEGDCYSREHSFPKSWFGGTVMPMYTDLFHIYPVDQYVNNRHSDNPFGVVGTPDWTSLNGSKLGPCIAPGYTGTVFEPRDEYKGDIARSYFYMSVRYYTEDTGWPGSHMVTGSQLNPWALAMMIQWHQADPVSQKEIDRNNVIYNIQHNRNPFIDHPEYVAAIWSSAPIKPEPTNHATSFSSVAGPPAYSAVTLTWTDATGAILPDGYLIRGSATGFDAIEFPVNGTPVSDGGLNLNVAAGVQSCILTGLSSSTTYYFKIFSYTNSGSAIAYKTDGTVPTTSATTSSGTGSGDIIISQYYEGTSYNKWIEITNLGPDVDLAAHPVYLLQIAGSGPKDVTITNPNLCALLNTGIFTSGSSRLARNTSAVIPVYAVADYTNGNLTFNGAYDAIFLSTSPSTVAPIAWDARTDVVGEVIDNLTTSYNIADMSLYRRNNISSGSTVWAMSDWIQLTNIAVDTAATGTPERLGYHGFNYFSKPTGNLDNLLNWGASADGSGTNPAAFNFINQVFTIQNRSTATLGNNWSVPGTGSKVILGNGVTGTSFNSGNYNIYLPALDIRAGSVFTVDTGSILTVSGTATMDGPECLTIRNGGTFNNIGTVIVSKDLINENSTQVSFGTGTIDLNGIIRQHISGQNTFHHLTVNSESGVSFTGNTRVEGTLSLIHGRIQLNGNSFFMGPVATIDGAPSADAMVVISGSEQLLKEFPPGFTGSFIFPVGDTTGNAEYSPVTLNFTQGTFAPGNFAGVSVINEKYPDPGITGNYLNRYWTISGTGISGFNCNATFHYVPVDVTGSEYLISGTRVSPEPWVTYGLTNTTAHQLFTGGITGFGSFTGLKSDTPPQNQELANINVINGENTCYDATQNLMVAGNGNLFVVDSGGFVTMIAGNIISLLPGVLVNSGGYFHGYITESGNFCSNPLSPVVSNPLNNKPVLSDPSILSNEPVIKVYPNPTSGICNLITSHQEFQSEIQLTIYNMTGKTILQQLFNGKAIHQFSLENQPTGMYIIHVNTGTTSTTCKIQKN